MTYKFTQEQIDAIRADVLVHKKSPRDVALAMGNGIGERSIRNIVTGRSYNKDPNAVKPFKTRKPKSKDVIDNVIALYKVHRSAYVVAELTGVSRPTISRYVRKHLGLDALKGKNKPRAAQLANTIDNPNFIKLPPQPRKPCAKKVKVVTLPENKIKTIDRLLKASWSTQEIASFVGVSVKTIEQFIAQKGSST